LALRRGTWLITEGTKLGFHLWDGLDIEEALFFLVTNMLIVCGQVAFDNALSIVHAFPHLFPEPEPLPSPLVLMRAILTSASKYDEDRIKGLQEAVVRLRKKSRSFYLASSTFQGQIRTDLLLLYSFCRVADDLVDNASSPGEASAWIRKLHKFLDMAYDKDETQASIASYIREIFPIDTQSALLQLPIRKLSRKPLDDLLHGFEMDMCFTQQDASASPPIRTESDLQLYAHRVAGTVAHMCLELIFFNYESSMPLEDQRRVIDAGDRMGVALQCVNIARDIAVDAKMDRVYIPSTWLDEEDLTFSSILKSPQGTKVERLRKRLLTKAFSLHKGARGAIEELPVEARGPLRVAVESYMEIGRVLSQKGYVVKAGRATVPKFRRLRVAWKTLNEN
jgi:15-cis-phytoene synthase / lycopene beta-cyclase